MAETLYILNYLLKPLLFLKKIMYILGFLTDLLKGHQYLKIRVKLFIYKFDA